jgi:hypothetical protein
VTATSLLLRSRTEVESVVDLPASKLGILEEYVRDGPPCCVIKGLDFKAVISACGFIIWCLWYRYKNR